LARTCVTDTVCDWLGVVEIDGVSVGLGVSDTLGVLL